MNNPIKDNRIINDITFAVRFRNFIKDVQVNDLPSKEEKEYLLSIADKLLDYQIKTVKNEVEIDYFFNNIKNILYD